jgi:hypothetical protein
MTEQNKYWKTNSNRSTPNNKYSKQRGKYLGILYNPFPYKTITQRKTHISINVRYIFSKKRTKFDLLFMNSIYMSRKYAASKRGIWHTFRDVNFFQQYG